MQHDSMSQRQHCFGGTVPPMVVFGREDSSFRMTWNTFTGNSCIRQAVQCQIYSVKLQESWVIEKKKDFLCSNISTHGPRLVAVHLSLHHNLEGSVSVEDFWGLVACVCVSVRLGCRPRNEEQLAYRCGSCLASMGWLWPAPPWSDGVLYYYSVLFIQSRRQNSNT